jgi:hypothetical protein
MTLTPASLALFLAYANDAGNWSGTPLVGGNVGDKPADKGNLTDLKKAGLVKTFQDDDNRKLSWLEFTPAGVALAREHGIKMENYI